tara:strand:+ start:204 stop:419 length:216 start_codon:yes stop_codon:yes gene_type:complete
LVRTLYSYDFALLLLSLNDLSKNVFGNDLVRVTNFNHIENLVIVSHDIVKGYRFAIVFDLITTFLGQSFTF